MSVVDAIPLLLCDEGYNISRSVRTRQSASAYFNRTAGVSPTSNQKGTFSFWIKRGLISYGTEQWLFAAGSSSLGCYFRTDDKLGIEYFGGSYLISTQVFRDPSAWYHIVFAVDSTQATSSNRAKLYVNGVQVTSFGTEQYPTQNATFNWMASGQACYINQIYIGGRYFDGYHTEFNYIDGQQLTPSSFGETDAVTGVWKPKKYAGTYGTNGFYLNFSDNSNNTAATIGKDYSGNGNNWTPNNISVTSGVTYDSMLDVPTQWADGGNGRGNYAVLNPISSLSSGITVSGGNLNFAGASASAYGSPATMLLTSGKWYFEVTAGSVASRYPVIGVQTELTAFLSSGFPGGYTANGFGYGSDGNKFVNNGAATSFGSTFTSGDVIGVAIDIDAGKVWLAKNNTWQASGDPAAGTNAAYSPTAGTPLYPCVGTYNGAGTHSANFGQRPFAYTPPTGFKALNTQNLPAPSILKGNQYFDVSLYTGTSAAQSIVNGGSMQPDFVWTKARNNASNHGLFDAVRGGSNILLSDSTGAEASGTYISSFNSNGFSVAGNSSALNLSTYTYAAWQWKESATAGFDIVTYTGDGTTSASRTIAHSLGVTPAFIITKKRSGGTDYGWSCWHKDLGGNYGIWLDKTSARNPGMWAGYSSFSSTVFTPPDLSYGNENGATYVNYLFAQVAGFSRFGSYTGNGSADGPFVFCGFRPAFIMIKGSSFVSNWFIQDDARNGYNINTGVALRPNLSNAEDGTTTYDIDILSNGFKLRSSAGDSNTSGATFIFMAFAENPFKNALAR